MTFRDVLKKLNIEDFEQRIWNSNSRGELSHIYDYGYIVEMFTDLGWFREWFLKEVKFAEENWERPASIFQHISTILQDQLESEDK